MKPLKLREAAFAPFGPTTMGRPWTGRAPLPPSKKKLKEFDSFQLPPPNKKGVKPVQKPGPYLPGTGPRYVSTREEILGEPLTVEEVRELVESGKRSSRQLNMGRDGLTHNMLDNIHAHWKRRRVCKIKCKGVCTVDMDNVCEQLEERTGGKIIYRRGGVLYLFRGRNYNYRSRPRFPLMLWKPVTPVYPRLIQQVPDGLTLEEATEMRKKGRKLIPICKLGKNGVYCDLAKNVREAFEVCELVRINCQGMNGSDFRKIGAKLRDLVPCVLISFEREHILTWRGREWKSSLLKPENDSEDAKECKVDNGSARSHTQMLSVEDGSLNTFNSSISPKGDGEQLSASESLSFADDDEPFSDNEKMSSADDDEPFLASDSIANVMGINETISDIGCSNDKSDAMNNIYRNGTKLENSGVANDTSEAVSDTYECQTTLDNKGSGHGESAALSVGSETTLGSTESTRDPSAHFYADSLNHDYEQNPSNVPQGHNVPTRLNGPNMERVLHLMQQAVENGSALVLDDATLNADSIYERSVAFAKSAPPGPVFRQRFRKMAVQKREKKEARYLEVKREVPNMVVSENRGNVRQTNRKKSKSSDDIEWGLDVVPSQGSLKIDELAKLLA